MEKIKEAIMVVVLVAAIVIPAGLIGLAGVNFYAHTKVSATTIKQQFNVDKGWGRKDGVVYRCFDTYTEYYDGRYTIKRHCGAPPKY